MTHLLDPSGVSFGRLPAAVGLLALASCGACSDDDAQPRADASSRPRDAAVASADRGGARAEDARAGGDALGPRQNSCIGPDSAKLQNAALPADYCAWIWARELGGPRGATVDERGNLLVIAGGAVVLLHDDDGDGISSADERVQLGDAPGLNHGIALQGGMLYASSATTVYRWPYDAARRALGERKTVVTGLPGGGHSTRTLIFDRNGNLYVSIGSASNVDSDSSRARIVRFGPSQLDSGARLSEAELFADGLRNEVGLRFDARGRLWGVENGSDNLSRADLGGDIHDENPGEELNLFEEPGAFYGYPYCWSEFKLPSELGDGPGSQWAYQPDSARDDAWCRDTDNVVPPVLSMQAHSAPLDILFYEGPSFPRDVTGDAFVTFHGSWNRTPRTGYKVVHLPFAGDGRPTGEVKALLEYGGSGDHGADWPHRPVGLAVGSAGQLFVTSDASGIVIAIGYRPPAE